MRIHEADVVLTDLALAILGGFLAIRLARSGSNLMTRSGSTLLGALGAAAFFGAVFHAFFPEETASRAGFYAWIPVILSIVVVAATLLDLAVRALAAPWSDRVRRTLVLLYALAFAGTATFVDESYGTIVRFYLPALLLFLIASARKWLRRAAPGWGVLAASVFVSMIAAALQQARVTLHPDYFDHNALYHVVQGVGIVMLYVGFKRIGRYDPARR